MDRRTFLKTGLGAAALLGVPGWVKTFAEVGAAGKEREKVREFVFSATKARINLGRGPDFWAWTYNGQVPGPELRVKEGETIRVILKNYLPEETTIHWHGIPLPNSMDGVPGVTQEGVKPGEVFVYEFEAKPAGTYIYHSHAGYQLDQGLYGPLIIDAAGEEGNYDREYTLMLEDWVMKDGGGVANTPRRSPIMGMMGGMSGRRGGTTQGRGPLLEPLYDAYAVNGKIYPEVTPVRVKAGDRIRLRMANPSSTTIYYLSLAGHSLTITHADGNPVMPTETDVLRIGMGERYDVEFVANNPGHWLLAAMERGFGEAQLRVPIIYKGVSRKTPEAPVFQRGQRLVSYWDLRSSFSPSSTSPEPASRIFDQILSGGMHSPFWTINGQVYPNAAPLRVNNGDRIRIRYWNRSMMPHPMHLHGHFFRVVNPPLPPDQWVLKDTVIVDPMQRMEIEFLADNPGRWFHHCHNLYHMMAGMANIVVYE
ncbi:MAG: multicopper oxidase family protein [Deltaproteobacteria bacterium]|nr:multicopper oxidase family protein [Deltaproteobacteria bacterium]